MAAPTYDAVSSGSAGAATVTVSHTCTGSNLVLFAATLIGNAANTMGSVTYGGVNMTQIGTPTVLGGCTLQWWYLVNPATGANDMVTSIADSISRRHHIIGISFADCDTSTPYSDTTEEADLSVDLSMTADQLRLGFAAVYDAEAPGSGAFTATGTAQTERADVGAGIFAVPFLAGGTQTGTGTVTTSWTYSATAENSVSRILNVNGITGGGGGDVSLGGYYNYYRTVVLGEAA